MQQPGRVRNQAEVKILRQDEIGKSVITRDVNEILVPVIESGKSADDAVNTSFDTAALLAKDVCINTDPQFTLAASPGSENPV